MSDKETPLHMMIANALIRQCCSGRLAPGSKVAGERELAAQWGASRGTVRLALQAVEQQGYVERRGRLGTYVRERSEAEQPRRVVYVFPEEKISPELLGAENWALSAELHRGLLRGASEQGLQVHVEHCHEAGESAALALQVQRLSQYDAAVFIGHQLGELQRRLAVVRPVFRIPDTDAVYPAPLLTASYDRPAALRSLLRHACECGCRRVGVVSFGAGGHHKLLQRGERFLQMASEYGLQVESDGAWLITEPPGQLDDLCRRLSQGHPDFLFCNHAERAVDLYEAAQICGLVMGHDLKAAGQATGSTFSGLLPRFTYIRVPMFELGQAIMRALSEQPFPASLAPLTAPLIIGGSTVPTAAVRVAARLSGHGRGPS